MNISRRSFLGFLSAAGTLAVLPPTVKAALIEDPLPEIAMIPFNGNHITALATYACAKLHRELDKRRFSESHQLRELVGVHLEQPTIDTPTAFQSSVDAAVFQLANECKYRNWKHFNILETPKAVEQAAVITNPAHVSIRAIKAYDVRDAAVYLRFDVAGHA